MTDNVISFGSRRNFLQEQAEKQEAERQAVEVAQKAAEHAITDHQATLLKMLDDARRLVEEGKLECLLMIGRHPETKYFYTDLALDARLMPSQDYFAYVGCLETLKMELTDTCAMAPALIADGTILAPESHIVGPDGEPFDPEEIE